MLPPEHLDHDPEKPADGWHVSLLKLASLAATPPVQDGPFFTLTTNRLIPNPLRLRT